MNKIKINAENIHYRLLNEKIHQALAKGCKNIVLTNVCGQRYIGDGLDGNGIQLSINGIPGNDLGAFMNGPEIIVNGNVQDGTGNTMNAGQIIVDGNAGDIAGHSMRGGRIFIRGDAGYRVGIHMKAYKEMFPVVIIGESARDFLGEYMAGGLLVVLGLDTETDKTSSIVGDFIGTGMHGGNIFIRGTIDERCLGKEVKISKPTDEDYNLLKKHLSDYCKYFNLTLNNILKKDFIKLYPYTHRPYGRFYAY
ncbi:MAG: hypothetical protein AUJ85_10095 [Elusimicrobia bacterium CG1_02_37_114]|nr:MAG: hypothetical protein AUJ85_10095 [Elusimicrobia bacterium CG1_02_37_114]PIZ13507.1 MAG: hypothetical protein COY53_04495 [Elusimicrobia bacterium CG_4_10_14_0_8_um_filter_37_32]